MSFQAEAAIREIAKREGKTVQEVLNDMQEALDAGMQNPDPAVQAEWRRIPHKGAKPTPQEVMDYMANKMKADRLN
jgi:hypothetical protein